MLFRSEVVRHLEEAMGLPGGVYNFGSENRYNTFDTARLFLRELAGSDSAGILKRNDERFASCPRNLTMDTDKIKSYGIRFFNTSEGIRKCSMEHREMSQARC